MNECNREIFTIKKSTIGWKYLNDCLFKQRAILDRGGHGPSRNLSVEMRCYAFSLPLHLYHAQHGAGAYLGSQDAARPVCSFVWPSCNSTWNRKRRFLPCCPRTMRSREIPERTWARSNYEVFYQQRRSKIFISPAENPTNWNVTSSCTSSLVFRTHVRPYSFLSYIVLKTYRKNRNLVSFFSLPFKHRCYTNSFHSVNKNFQFR